MRTAIAWATCFLLVAVGSAQAFEVGPPVRGSAPAITVRDAAGVSKSLDDVMGPKGVVLVFFRSAKWCPFCQAQLISLRDAAAPLTQRGYGLAGLSYDPPDILAGFKRQRDIPFTLLSDEGSKAIDAFGLRDPQYKPGSVAFGVPQPSIFVIDRGGIILAKLAEEGFKNRPTNEAVLDAVDRLSP